MRVYMAYRTTMHGMPIYPEFIFRVKWSLGQFLITQKYDDFIIKEVNLDVPKFGVSNNDFEKQNIVEGDIKNVNITFKNKDGILHSYNGKEALEIVKNLPKK